MTAADRTTSRRELLRASVRWLSLGLLAGGGVVLLRRHASAEPCDLRIPCAACDLRRGCERTPPDPERIQTPKDESWRTRKTESPGASS